MTQFAEISFPISLPKNFTYEVPSSFNLKLFSRVIAPFGKSKKVGLVVDLHNRQPPFSTKPLTENLDPEALLSPTYFEWLTFASQYYMSSLGDVLATALPKIFFEPHPLFRLANKKTRSSAFKDHWSEAKTVELSPEQEKVSQSLSQLQTQKTFESALLFGVTGSGKTEIYLRAAELALAQGRQTLILVPEIGLTPQMVGRFAQTFGNKLGLTHSGLTDNQRFLEWRRVRDKEAMVVIGTRSSLFLPFRELGTIIIDEEHDPSYKQEERMRYHARDLGIARAKMENCLVILGSATPSVETFFNARQNKYHFFHLAARAGTSRLPQVHIVPMAIQKEQTGSPLALSVELSRAIKSTLEKGEQTLILLNRRGFAQSSYCNECKKMVACKNCSVSMPYHRRLKKLLCHYCDNTLDLPKLCPSCQSPRMTLLGLGTETLEEELKTFFPQARVGRLDKDSSQAKGSLMKILKDWKEHRLDILVGTQMVAKGHDVPNVTLVGVLGVDSSLNIPDFRASERTFQLLMQVAGRSGRGERPGRVIVQSFSPEHSSIQLAAEHDYLSFYEWECAIRRELSYPPFGRLIRFQFQSGKIENIEKFAALLEKNLSHLEAGKEVQILGPAPSPLEKIRGQYRYGLILKSAQRKKLRQVAQNLMIWLEKEAPSGLKWSVDVDPIEML